MTNRRPDIHCSSCGRYMHSLSHRPDEQVFPKRPLCGKCPPKEVDDQKSESSKAKEQKKPPSGDSR